jgi:glycyl-tRNA synthetase beta subunit
MIPPGTIQAAITAIETGLEYARDYLASYDDNNYATPERLAVVTAHVQAEITQMEAALAGLRAAVAWGTP